jgi:hypothetical protein
MNKPNRSAKKSTPPLLYGFANVDPLTGDYPSETATQAQEVSARMRWILRGKSRPELDELIFTVNTLLNDQRLADLAFSQLEIAARRYDEGVQTHDDAEDTEFDFTSDVQSLLVAARVFDIDDLDWSHLFASLALALLDTAAAVERSYTQWAEVDGPLHRWRILFNVTTWTTDAHEAGAFAQALAWGKAQALERSNSHTGATELKAQLTRQNRLAAFQRHAPTQKAISALTAFHVAGRFDTYKACAWAFCEAHPDLVRHLAPTNRIRTLSEGLSRQLKSLRSKGS